MNHDDHVIHATFSSSLKASDNDDIGFWSSPHLELAYVEVSVIPRAGALAHLRKNDPYLTAASAKLQLIQLSANSLRWKSSASASSTHPVTMASKTSRHAQNMAFPEQDGFPDDHAELYIRWKGTPACPDKAVGNYESNRLHPPLLLHGPLFRRDRPVNQEQQKIKQFDPALVADEDLHRFVVHLYDDDPTVLEPWPCYCLGFAFDHDPSQESSGDDLHERPAIVTETTMIRILPVFASQLLSSLGRGADLSSIPWRETLTGEVPEPPASSSLAAELLHTHDSSTLRALTLKLTMLLDDQPIRIGTSPEALSLRRQHLHRQKAIRQAGRLATHQYQPSTRQQANPPISTTTGSTLPLEQTLSTLFRKGALIVHSPHHGAGKTCLVEAVARQMLNCRRVHIVRPAPLLSKYGTAIDAALETLLHQAVLSAAFHRERVCIILDNLDTLMPLSRSPSSALLTSGDAAVPVLQSLAVYLSRLVTSLQRHGEFPFPTKNPLYSVGGTKGCAISVQMVLVAIVTCPDDGGRSSHDHSSRGSRHSAPWTILEVLGEGVDRYRLPTLTAEARLAAVNWVLQQEKVEFGAEVEPELASLAASAVWAYGPAFRKISRMVRHFRDKSLHQMVTGEVCRAAFHSIRKIVSDQDHWSQVQFILNNTHATSVFESTVGGNRHAKAALEDALTLDPTKRHLLTLLGLSAPGGILLYGPPGTGKSLLAKSVAQLLQNTASRPPFGGTFITINSTDIVRAEVGAGEKELLVAFESARMNAPSVVFIDEFQALFTDRSRGGSSRLTTTLLQCMDDIKPFQPGNTGNGSIEDLEDCEQGGQIVVLAATNTPWMIDKAFLHPGRFDRAVHVGLPEFEDRISILKLHFGRMKSTTFQNDPRKCHEVCQSLAKETEGFSGADIAALCRSAAVQCLLSGDDYVDLSHFLEVLDKGIKPSSSWTLVERIKNWRSP